MGKQIPKLVDTLRLKKDTTSMNLYFLKVDIPRIFNRATGILSGSNVCCPFIIDFRFLWWFFKRGNDKKYHTILRFGEHRHCYKACVTTQRGRGDTF